MVGTIWLIDLIVGGVSVAFLALLLFVYGKNLRQVRSPFTLGLVVFALLFLVEGLVGISYHFWMANVGYGVDVAVPLLTLNAVKAGAFGVLAFISWD